jgi:3-hydroxy-9,10-secoandrosta-1,3,5(10)-triene-9,17-dione monooxygenase reductase component
MTEDVKRQIGRAIGRVPSGVFILTAQHNDQPVAMMASWVQQAAFEPPVVTVAVAKQRPITDSIRRAKRFALSVLAEHNSLSLMKKYARGISPNEDPFQGVATLETPAGVPVLADALAWLDCSLLSVCDYHADHELFIGEVTAGDILKDGAALTHQRGNGFHY